MGLYLCFRWDMGNERCGCYIGISGGFWDIGCETLGIIHVCASGGARDVRGVGTILALQVTHGM